MRKTLWFAAAPLALFGFVDGELHAPANEYTVLDTEARPFVTAFDAAEDKVRLVMYVSPTCGGCLLGAREVQKDVLEKVDSDRIEAFVVWGPKNGAREEHVDRVTELVTDPRARQYWDEHAAVAAPYDELFDLAGPCAGVFALYAPGTTWSAKTPPRPVIWQDAHADQRGREDNPPLDAEEMVERVLALLGSTGTP